MKIIKTTEQLRDFCHPLLMSQQTLTIGIDTEFIRQRTYWPKLCLVQITCPSTYFPEAVLIDPLGDIELDSFQLLLAATHITKVIHSARQDIEIFWHEWKTIPQTFFDTQIAAMVCGLGDGIGYGTLVKSLFDFDLDKDSQYTDWSHRPLTDKQLAYAVSDVNHLLPAYEILTQQLSELNRVSWMEDDLATLLNPHTYQTDPQHAWLRIHTHRHKPQNLAYMQDICAWREINAIRLNVNRGRLLRDECILKIGLSLPKTIEEFQTLADSALLTTDMAQELFSLYQEAFNKPNHLWPQAPKKKVLSLATRHRLDVLREKLSQIAEELNVPPRLIATKTDLINLVQGQWENNRVLTGWRHEIFGRIALELCSYKQTI